MLEQDQLQEEMVEAWRDGAKRAGKVIEDAIKAPALFDVMYVRALGNEYQRCMSWAGYWMTHGGR
jgi:hypothetical protein